MVPNAIGIIFANNGYASLQGLAQERPIAAVPFGGRYRILDFALSSMVNSGIMTIGLVTPHQYRTLLDHLGAGKDWFLDRKAGGLFILPGVMHSLAGNSHTFCIKDLQHNLEYLQKDSVENVVISCGDQIYNMNIMDALEFHNEKQADVTLIYKENDTIGDLTDEMFLEMDENQKVSNIRDQKGLEWTEIGRPHYVNILIIRRLLLIDIVERYSSFGCMGLVNILTKNMEILKIYGSPTQSVIGTIRTINDYFDQSMELLDQEVRERLWWGADRIHTKIVDNPPTQYSSQAKVGNSLIASGCSIAGVVLNSIIFRGVIIEKGCKIMNSIIMSKCHIHENAQMEYAILDKAVTVHEGNVLKGRLSNPLVIHKRTVI